MIERDKTMRVQFHKTATRSYAVVVLREQMEPLRMDAAPGYDELMPHDLQHFIVERELKIRLGIFGQLAAGGDAGTFHKQSTRNTRASARGNRSVKKRGNTLAQTGKADSMKSERATFIAWHHWLACRADPRARDMHDTARSILSGMSTQERNEYTPANLARIKAVMDSTSVQWFHTGVGEHIELTW